MVNMQECLICKNSFDSDITFNRHLRSHKTKIEEYYINYYPKKDLLTGEQIPFKSKEQYLSSDFLNKHNLNNWIKKTDKAVVSEYFKKLFSARKEKKELIYSLSQVECRSLPIPNIIKLNDIWGDYYKTCESLGFVNKYQYPSFAAEITQKTPKNDDIIYVDTREQKALIFNLPTEKRTIKFGDYAFAKNDKKIYFERKSISDLIGTLSAGYERFQREIERSISAESKLIIIVEEKFSNAIGFNYLSHVYKKDTRVTPEFIFHKVRELIQKYPSIQFLFADGRRESVRLIEKIFLSDIDYTSYDLQLCYDLKLL